MIRPCKVLILAGGRGSRMKHDRPKVLIPLSSGQTIIEAVVDACSIEEVDEVIVVTNDQILEDLQQLLSDKVSFVLQDKPQGTGHAVMAAGKKLINFQGDLIIVVGDAPFISQKIINDLRQKHLVQGNSCTFLSAIFEDKTPPYGRVVRAENGQVVRIVEEKDATEAEKIIKEVSSSHYIFDYQKLVIALAKITNDNVQSEYYLPDVIKIMLDRHEKIEALRVGNPYTTFGINTLEELSYSMRKIEEMTCQKL